MKTASQTISIPDSLKNVRNDFPILKQTVHGKPLVYLDNAASTQKPAVVIDTLNRYYSEQNANIHRGVHFLSSEATSAYERARGKIANYLNAADDSEIVFTRGATESINLVAHSFVEPIVSEGDEILITYMEHHANIVPWQLLCERTGAVLKVAPVTDSGEVDLDAYQSLLSDRTRFVSLVHVSNAIGTVNPIETLLAAAKSREIPTLVDAAQSVQHMPVDVRQLDCDFLVFSGHKIFAPTGIGALYGKADRLASMRPYQGGGDMIAHVSFEGTTYKDAPSRFEAGTPHIAGGIGLGAAIDYLSSIGLESIDDYERQLIGYAEERLNSIDGLTILGKPAKRAGALSFVMDDVHPHDIGTILDTDGVAIRAGHHCCEPLMRRFGAAATARASFSFYNTTEEVDALVESLGKVKTLFG